MEFKIGVEAINSYKRLSYTPWHAIAEFIDNSTQAYFDNKKILDEAYQKESVNGLVVSITYDRSNNGGSDSFLRIYDSSIGMSAVDLENAMKVAFPPSNPTGRSRYGMGLKTAACWLGNKWTVRTKKLGENFEYQATVDVAKIAKGDTDLKSIQKKRPENEHYTVIEIFEPNRKFHARTLGKIKDFLRSMYREDFRHGYLTLEWQGEILSWQQPEMLIASNGDPYYKKFGFSVGGISITGWVGLLKKGTRSWAGFAIIHSGRVVKGWPDAWRPEKIYGQYLGSNDLINQRVIGEIYLDGFDVSHTKDDILWLGTQEEDVEKALYESSKELVEIAKSKRYRGQDKDERGPTEEEVDVAIDEVKSELESPEMVDQIKLVDVPEKEVLEIVKEKLLDDVTKSRPESINAKVGSLIVKVYLASDLSINDPYVLVESTKDLEVLVIINTQHPHWLQLKASEGVANYLRHCVYDAIAEWKAKKMVARIDPDTIKMIKDGLLRVPFLMELHQTGESDE
jgi:hypothetical protein